jgi:lysophospholipase L1-like esterase
MPLRIGAAHIALRDSGASIAPGTDRTLTFGNAASVTIAPGAAVLSDPVSLTVPALSDLAVSLHSPGTVRASTIHSSAAQTSFVSPPGNYTGSVKLPAGHTITSWPFLTEVDVSAPGSAAIVALGDSITDASITKMDANHRWPDLLALRLHPMGGLGVVNRGISGNRLLRDPGDQPLFGKAALTRLDRDVFASAGVRHMIVLIGINDIGHPGTGNIAVSESVTAEDLIAGYRRVIAAARKKGIAVYGATLAPFEGTRFEGYFTPRKEAVRQAVNTWIRGSGEFDAVIDFDQALRDPAHPARLLPVYDSGDHLHPNDRGTQAMADAIPLGLFNRTTPAPAAQRQ